MPYSRDLRATAMTYDGIIDFEKENDINNFGFPIRQPDGFDPYVPLLKKAWENDIVTVIGCTNRGEILGDWSPLRFGRSDNPMITVCTYTQHPAFRSLISILLQIMPWAEITLGSKTRRKASWHVFENPYADLLSPQAALQSKEP